MIKHVFIDMDGVLCCFASASFAANGAVYNAATYPRGEWSIAKVIGITDDQFWRNIDAQGEQFWATLDPLPWSSRLIAAVREVVGDEWSIASSPSRSAASSSGKVKWMQHHLGSRFRNYFLGENKFLLSQPGHVLIDDNEVNCKRFAERGGGAICFPQPWNNEDLAVDPVEYIMSRLTELHR